MKSVMFQLLTKYQRLRSTEILRYHLNLNLFFNRYWQSTLSLQSFRTLNQLSPSFPHPYKQKPLFPPPSFCTPFQHNESKLELMKYELVPNTSIPPKAFFSFNLLLLRAVRIKKEKRNKRGGKRLIEFCYPLESKKEILTFS